MLLKSVKFIEFESDPQSWTLEGLALGQRNLIVGKNASGKSRTLNVIGSLASNLAGLKPPGISGNYDVIFDKDGKIIEYKLKYNESEVSEEKLTIDGRVLLSRGDGGKGTIFAEALEGGKNIDFQTPPSGLAVVTRRDTIQHKFLEPLYEWGISLRHYHFGRTLGKERFDLFEKGKGNEKINDRDENQIVALYRQAVKEFNDDFTAVIINDMREIDYDIQEIGLRAPVSIRILSGPGELIGIYVKEKGLNGITDQYSMSQGMFRVLSMLIQVNYSQMAKKSSCILVDDIGEGLDFDRSCKLIDLLRNKAKDHNIQLILSTNDRFVMNKVPLEEWSVLQRQGSIVKVRNYDNSKEIFEEFKFTGLSNFSFLEMDFVNESRGEEAPIHE